MRNSGVVIFPKGGGGWARDCRTPIAARGSHVAYILPIKYFISSLSINMKKLAIVFAVRVNERCKTVTVLRLMGKECIFDITEF